MDVLGLTNSGVALISFWERLVIVGMITVILALFLRQITEVVVKRE